MRTAGETFSKKLESTIKDFSCKLNPKNKKHTVPWMNSDILELMKKRDLALKNCKQIKFNHDRQHFAMLRNKVVKTLRKAKADFFLRIINEARGNSKTIWNKLSYLKVHCVIFRMIYRQKCNIIYITTFSEEYTDLT